MSSLRTLLTEKATFRFHRQPFRQLRLSFHIFEKCAEAPMNFPRLVPADLIARSLEGGEPPAAGLPMLAQHALAAGDTASFHEWVESRPGWRATSSQRYSRVPPTRSLGASTTSLSSGASASTPPIRAMSSIARNGSPSRARNP